MEIDSGANGIIYLLGMFMLMLLCIVVACVVGDICIQKQPKIKPEYESICIGGYQYELIVNEFNEPVFCEDK